LGCLIFQANPLGWSGFVSIWNNCFSNQLHPKDTKLIKGMHVARKKMKKVDFFFKVDRAIDPAGGIVVPVSAGVRVFVSVRVRGV